MISVVIPMCNSKDTIVDCICSVLSQTRTDLIEEIIVVDDGSQDGSGEIVKNKFSDERKVRLISKQNGGVSAARNAGIRATTSKWVAFLDSDDMWLNEKIEKQWIQVEKDSSIKFIGSNRNNENIHWGKHIRGNLYSLDLKHVLIKTWPHTSTALVQKSVFEEIGLFNEKMRYAEDGDMWNRIACKYHLYYIAESLEIAGGGKMQFGERGLSSNLKKMHEGNIRNIRCLKKNGIISSLFYEFLIIYNNVKYISRIMVAKMYKNRLYK